MHLPERYAPAGHDSVDAPPLLSGREKVLGRLMRTPAHLVRSTRTF